MYEFKTNVSVDEYNKFVDNFSMAPITQDYRWSKIKDNWNSNICALYKNNKIVGASLLLIKEFPLKLKMIYSPRGFLIDYTNIEDLKEFTKGIKEYAKKIRAFVVKIDPPIAIKESYYDTLIDKDKQIAIKNYSINSTLKINNLAECGYIHQGFKKEINSYIQPRYNAVISLINDKNEVLSVEELLNSFKRNAKRYFGDFQEKRGISFVCVHDNSYLDEFYSIIKSTEDRQKISLRDKEYFKRIMNTYKEDAYMYIAKIDVNKFIEFLNNEISKEKDLELVKKYKEQLVDANNVKEKYGDIVSIAATLAIIPPNKEGLRKVEYLYAGTFEDVFPYLNSNVAVHIYSFIDFLNMGYHYADLEGIDGSLNDHLSKTKEKYNPIIFEYIGEFDLSTNNFWYFIFSKFSVQLKRIYKVMRGKNK